MQVRAAILETDESAWQAALTQETPSVRGPGLRARRARRALARLAAWHPPRLSPRASSPRRATCRSPTTTAIASSASSPTRAAMISRRSRSTIAHARVEDRFREGRECGFGNPPSASSVPRPCGSNSPSALRTCSPTPARWYSMESSPALSQSACVTGFCASPGASTDLSPGAARRQRGGRVLVVTCPQTAPARRSGCPGGLPRRRPGMMRSAAESTSPARRR